MLNRQKLLKELSCAADKLFIDNSADYEYAHDVWQKILKDPLFAQKVASVEAPWPIPAWHGVLGQHDTVLSAPSAHHVISVDGSQIYPDRHAGVSCYLINIGSVALHYGSTDMHPVEFLSEPYIFTQKDTDIERVNQSTEYVNGKRQELEFTHGLSFAREQIHKASTQEPFLLFFDGSLIFWHLEAKDTQLRDIFLPRYIQVLEELYAERVPMASYISMPRSRELANLVRLYACNFAPHNAELLKRLDWLLDIHVAQFFLCPGQRSQIFKNQSSITAFYPASVQPYFFYIHGGIEIGRVEIPAWIAHDSELLEHVASLTLDQMNKGHGYPVVLAEAHEQAVVKGPDRDFFYHLLCKLGIDRKQRIHASQKLMRKRGMGI